MKTFLGVTTGFLAGVIAGISGFTVLCSRDHGLMKYFAETCGYKYESEGDET